MVVWCIPGDDVGVLHASALFVERKFPDASQQPDKAQKKIASAKWLHQTWWKKTRMCLLKWCLQLGVFSQGSTPEGQRCPLPFVVAGGFRLNLALTTWHMRHLVGGFFGAKVVGIVDVVKMILPIKLLQICCFFVPQIHREVENRIFTLAMPELFFSANRKPWHILRFCRIKSFLKFPPLFFSSFCWIWFLLPSIVNFNRGLVEVPCARFKVSGSCTNAGWILLSFSEWSWAARFCLRSFRGPKIVEWLLYTGYICEFVICFLRVSSETCNNIYRQVSGDKSVLI